MKPSGSIKSSAYGKITENAVYLKDDGINVGALDETGETTFAARIDHVRCYVQSLDDGSCNLLAVYEYKVSTNPDKMRKHTLLRILKCIIAAWGLIPAVRCGWCRAIFRHSSDGRSRL